MLPLSRELLIGLLVVLGAILLFILVLIFRKQRELRKLQAEPQAPSGKPPSKEEKKKEKERRKEEEKRKKEEEAPAEAPPSETGPTDIKSIKSRIISPFHGGPSKPAEAPAPEAPEPPKPAPEEGKPPAPEPKPAEAPKPPEKGKPAEAKKEGKKPARAANGDMVEGYEVGDEGLLQAYPEAKPEPPYKPAPKPPEEPKPAEEPPPAGSDAGVELVDLREPEEEKPPAAAEPAPPAPAEKEPPPEAEKPSTQTNAAEITESPRTYVGKTIGIKGTISLSSKGESDSWYVLFDETGSVVVRSTQEIPYERCRLSATVKQTRLGQTYLDVLKFYKL